MSFIPIVEECSKDLNEAEDKEKLLINEIINNPAFAIIFYFHWMFYMKYCKL